MRLYLSTLFVILSLNLFAQSLKTVSAQYTLYAPESMPLSEAKKIALERAKIQAIEEEFGTIISLSNTMALSNVNGQSESKFYSVGMSDVKGEWVETIGHPSYDEIIYKDHQIVVTCHVKGKIREIVTAQTEFSAIPLRNYPELRAKSYEFVEGDDLFLYFKSPQDGFLSVYLVDEDARTVYCALPYRNSNGAPKHVKADTEYILFSKQNQDASDYNWVDEYVIVVNDDLEFNDLYVLFSPTEYAKAPMNGVPANAILPKTADLDDFHSWLSKIRTKNPQMSLQRIILKLSK